MLTLSLQASTKKSIIEHILEQKAPSVRRKVDRTAQKRLVILRLVDARARRSLIRFRGRQQKNCGNISVGTGYLRTQMTRSIDRLIAPGAALGGTTCCACRKARIVSTGTIVTA